MCMTSLAMYSCNPCYSSSIQIFRVVYVEHQLPEYPECESHRLPCIRVIRVIRVPSNYSAWYMLNTNYPNIPNVYDTACHVFV